MTNTQRITASELRVGHMIPALDNAYVAEVEVNDGYLSYPSTGGGYAAAMPEDTILVTYHDSEGNENYILFTNPDHPLDVYESDMF